MKCIPAGSRIETSVMRMSERQLTEVIKDLDKYLYDIPIVLIINMILVFKFCVIYGICLCLFVDAILFDMMLKTAFGDGVDTIKDLIDRDMSLRKVK